MINLGKNLKELRKSKGVTQSAFANYLGVSFQAVSKWERNESYPDITVLPEIAGYFGVSVDALLGVNTAENEQRVNEYLSMYETMHYKKTPELLSIFQKAVSEFPNDCRILVRYMELLTEENDLPFIKVSEGSSDSNNPYKNGFIKNPDYEKLSHNLMKIYNNIQTYCTNDSIRIRSKHIIINHLMKKYALSFDEQNEKWYCDNEAFDKANEILSTMPSLCDARECIEPALASSAKNFFDICRRNIEELSFLLQDSIISYCYYPYDNDFSAEYKIDVINHINGIFKMTDSDDYVSKNRIHLMYNYGHLGHLYAKTGDFEKALESIRICFEYAKNLDSDPEESERISRFYNNGPSEFKKMTMCERMKELVTKHYPLPDEFKRSERLKELLSFD